MTRESFIDATMPSAILSDGLVTIPIFAVNQISISESYHLPNIGATSVRTAVSTHDDTVTLSGLLIGADRYTLKFALESIAESSKRGTALEGLTHGAISGLVLITSLTVRTDMQVQSLTFSASAGRRDVIDLTISLAYMPRPGVLAKLLEEANIGVQALRDF